MECKLGFLLTGLHRKLLATKLLQSCMARYGESILQRRKIAGSLQTALIYTLGIRLTNNCTMGIQNGGSQLNHIKSWQHHCLRQRPHALRGPAHGAGIYGGFRSHEPLWLLVGRALDQVRNMPSICQVHTRQVRMSLESPGASISKPLLTKAREKNIAASVPELSFKLSEKIVKQPLALKVLSAHKNTQQNLLPAQTHKKQL